MSGSPTSTGSSSLSMVFPNLPTNTAATNFARGQQAIARNAIMSTSVQSSIAQHDLLRENAGLKALVKDLQAKMKSTFQNQHNYLQVLRAQKKADEDRQSALALLRLGNEVRLKLEQRRADLDARESGLRQLQLDFEYQKAEQIASIRVMEQEMYDGEQELLDEQRDELYLERFELEQDREHLAAVAHQNATDRATFAATNASLAARQAEIDSIPIDRTMLAVAQELEQVKSQRLCKLCATNTVDLVELECGHIWCCEECHKMRLTRVKEELSAPSSLGCGICREGDGKVRKIFF
jgi:hypothetical protein